MFVPSLDFDPPEPSAGARSPRRWALCQVLSALVSAPQTGDDGDLPHTAGPSFGEPYEVQETGAWWDGLPNLAWVEGAEAGASPQSPQFVDTLLPMMVQGVLAAAPAAVAASVVDQLVLRMALQQRGWGPAHVAALEAVFVRGAGCGAGPLSLVPVRSARSDPSRQQGAHGVGGAWVVGAWVVRG